MSQNNVFKRYELKYLLTKEEKKALSKIMSHYLRPDEFGKSTIRNIYYDTADKLLIRRSLDKPIYKEKLRVRSYGRARPDSQVFIEIKKKYKGIVYKRRMSLEEKIARNYLVKNIPLENETQISREIDYLIKVYGRVQPSIFLSYEREAYFSITDPNFRMTFDQNIITRDYDLSLDSEIYGESDLLEGGVILEVKTAMGIPKWLVDFFSKNKIYKASFSKYGNAYKKHMLDGIFRKNNLQENENNGGMKYVI